MRSRVFSVAFSFVGAVVGAGFASGREISLYFAHTSVFTPLLSGLILTGFFYVFLSIGRTTGGNIGLLGGKAAKIMPYLIRICSYVTMIAMIAGSEEIIFALFHIHGGSVISGVLALIVVLLGVEKIKISNLFIVPAIMIMIAMVFARQKEAVPLERLSVVPAFSYATLNVIGAGYFAAGMSGDFSEKECVITAIIGGISITVLILAVFFSIQNDLDEAMPLLEAAKRADLAFVGNVVAYLAIFSTLTGCLSVASDNKPYLAVVITSLSFIVAVFGFRNVVDKAYPLIGAAGGVMSVAYLILFLVHLARRKKGKKIPEAPPRVKVREKIITLS